MNTKIHPASPHSQSLLPIPAAWRDGLAVFLLLFATLIVYASALAPGRTFLPADLLLLTPPWSHHSQELEPGFHYVQRPAWDPLFQFYAARHYLAESLQAGQVPLWNPHAFSGTPFAADGQSAVFYPVNWLFAVLPLASAFGIVAALHTFFSGVFFYLYGRRLNLSRTASLAGGLTWMFCGVQVGWAMWQVIDSTLCWLPLALYFWEGWRKNRDLRQALGLSLALGMALLSGHLQFAFYVWLIVGTYALYRPPVWAQGAYPRFLPGLAAILLLGIGLASVQIFATADFLGQTARANFSYSDLVGTRLPPAQLILLLAPEFFGGQRDWMHYSFIGGDYYETVVYCGAAAMTFAGAAFSRRRGDLSHYWLAVIAVSVLIGCGTPVYALFFYGVPLFKSFHGLSRAFVLLDFAVAALCALGLDRLGRSTTAQRRMIARNVCIALVVVILLGYRIGISGNGPDLERLLTHDFSYGGIDHTWFEHTLEQIGIALALVLAACAVIAYAPTRWIGVSAALVALDMLLFASGINIGSDANLLYPPTPETAFVTAHQNGGRVVCLGDGVPAHAQSRLVPNSAMSLDWDDVSGSDPLMLRNYDDFVQQLNVVQSGSPSPTGYGMVSDAGNGALDWLNVTQIVAPRQLAYAAYQMTDQGDPAVYANPSAKGPAWLSHAWTVQPDAARARRDLLASPIKSVVELDRAPFAMQSETSELATGAVTIRSDAPGAIVYDVTSNESAIVTTSQIACPGWVVSLDGHRVMPLTAQGLLLAVPVLAGHHTLTLRYTPAPIQLGLYLSALSWLIVAAGMTRMLFRARASHGNFTGDFRQNPQ